MTDDRDIPAMAAEQNSRGGREASTRLAPTRRGWLPSRRDRGRPAIDVDDHHALAERHRWFAQTILPHRQALHARLRRLIRDPADVDDDVAEVLARAYAAEDYRRIVRGRAYVFGIARNLIVDRARRAKVVSFDVVADLDLLLIDDSVEAGLQARDELRRLRAVIDALPEQCRRVFVARRVHDWSTGEIAENMGLSVSTVEKHLTKAVLRVMRAVQDREDVAIGRSGVESRATADRGGGR